MSEKHLSDIKHTLEKNHWIIDEVLEGNDYDISSIWVIVRPNGDSRLHLEFQGLDETKVLPIEKSFACRIKEKKDISLYFGKINKSWSSELNKFISNLNQEF